MPGPRRISFEYNPTVYDAVNSEAFVTGIVGPVGSGKSVGGCAWCMKIILEQKPDPRNIRPSRIAIIRNTTPELKATTIKTWLEQFPEGQFTRIVYASPITYYVKVPPQKNGMPGIEAEVMFVGLDKPKDVRRLLSLEITAAWVNEAREVPKAIIDALVDRVGRYPPAARVPATQVAIWMDTNPPDTDHWWYSSFETDPPEGQVELDDGRMLELSWRVFHQPAAVLELEEEDDGHYYSIEPGYPRYKYRPQQVIEAANRVWGVNPKAENLPNLRAGYYHQQLKNKRLQHIQAYQQAKYVFVQDGRPVTPEYLPELHGSNFPVLFEKPYLIGVDIGGGTLQPSAVIVQRHERGNWLVQGELVCFDLGVDRFIDLLKEYLVRLFDYRNDVLDKCEAVWLDPASEKRDEVYEQKIRDYFLNAGFPARGAPTQDPRTRIDAISAPLSRMFDAKPGLLVSKSRCPWLHKGLSGAWYYRRKQVVGSDIFSDHPEKNEYSHVCEALGYGLVGGGEYRVRKSSATGGVHRIQSSHRVFA